MAANLPSGTVTFLFTDIESSTKLAQQLRSSWEELRDRHGSILHQAIEAHDGYMFEIVGDSFCVAFHKPADALLAALDAQRGLQAEARGDTTLRIRMGIHTGVAEPDGHHYRGYLTLSSVARIMSAAHGGQILISQSSFDLVQSHLPDDVMLRDMGEHRLKDLAHSQHLYQPVVADLPSEFPPLKTLDALPHNLPVQLTSFIGRQREVNDLKDHLRQSRLLTLTGPGGTGKTRLALQAAAEVLDGFPDGAWLVELAPVTDPESVPAAVAAALNVREQPGIAPLAVLKHYLSGRNLLLVLDNCEHLLDASAQLVDALLHAAPQLRVLATSREALGISGELAYPVAALPLPGPAASTAASVSDCDAVRLFVDRAAAAQPSFALSDDNASAVVQIATRLDGLPLALELAASRSRGMTIDQIASKLDDRFHLLTGGSRTALPRQRTLEATIDWSYHLISQEERSLLGRLTVFLGTWTLEAAQHVAAFGGLRPEQVLSLLAGLVEKSLVVLDLSSSRYHMLETVRAFGLERLRDAGEEAECRARYIDFYLAYAESCNFAGVDDQDSAARLLQEQDNLVAAISGCQHVEAGGQLALRFMEATGEYWMVASQSGVGYRLARLAVSLPGAEIRNRARGRTLLTIAILGFFRGDLSRAQRAAEESLSIAREVGDGRGEASSLRWLANSLYETGKDQDALELHYEGLRRAQELHYNSEAARIQNDLAEVLRSRGDFQSARALYEQSLETLLPSKPTPYAVVVLVNLAAVSIQLGDLEGAKGWLAKALHLEIQPAFLGEWGGGLFTTAGMASVVGEWPLAARFYGAAEAERATKGEVLDRADAEFIAPLIDRARKQLGQQDYQQAFDEGQRLRTTDAMVEALAWIEGAT
jgi:predicted ATPase/class 3 adenylate cyclase/Tfp pilus assembly protein PilF